MLNIYLANKFALNSIVNKFAKEIFNCCLNVESILNLYTIENSKLNNFLNIIYIKSMLNVYTTNIIVTIKSSY